MQKLAKKRLMVCPKAKTDSIS